MRSGGFSLITDAQRVEVIHLKDCISLEAVGVYIEDIIKSLQDSGMTAKDLVDAVKLVHDHEENHPRLPKKTMGLADLMQEAGRNT